VYLTLVRTGEALNNLSALMIEANTPGFKVGEWEKKCGLNAARTGEIHFENCSVPEANMIGTVNEGLAVMQGSLDLARVMIGAIAVGIGQEATTLSAKYSKERVQFNRPISEFQAIRFLLADMAIGNETARQAVYYAARMRDANQLKPELAAIVKCAASDAAMRTTTDAIQVHGGYGYTKEFKVERLMREAKGLQIIGGTNQIARVTIAREMLK
jgi:butyryl-CoA dehydrogenase